MYCFWQEKHIIFVELFASPERLEKMKKKKWLSVIDNWLILVPSLGKILKKFIGLK